MKQQQFEQKYAACWERFSRQLAVLEGRKAEAASTEFIRDYREICQHLALAKDRHYSPNLLRRLNHLALSGQEQLYGKRSIYAYRVVEFLLHGFPAAVRREWVWVLLAAILFFGVWIVTMILTLISPELVYSVMDRSSINGMEEMYGPFRTVIYGERTVAHDVHMFGFYVWNNIGIGFRMLSAFVMAGFGTLFMLIVQGVTFGATSAHMINMGYSTAFFSFTSGHSSYELLACMLSGAVGLKLGWSMLMPGRLSRLGAIRQAAMDVLPIIYGLFAMLFIAAVVEAFWSSTDSLPSVLRYCVGVTGWTVLITYFVLAGRNRFWFIPGLLGGLSLSCLILWFRFNPPDVWVSAVWPCVAAFGLWFVFIGVFSPARTAKRKTVLTEESLLEEAES